MPTFPVTGDVTPARSTRAHFDLPQYQITEQWWGGLRLGSEVGSLAVAIGGGRDTLATERVRYWPGPRVWTLAPVQETMGAFQEGLPVNLNPDEVVIAPGQTDLMNPSNQAVLWAKVLERAIWTKPGNLPASGGMYIPGVTDYGDSVYVKGVPAYGDFEGRILSSPPSPQASTGVPGLLAGNTMFKPANAPMDTVFNPPRTFAPDQPFYLRWVIPGSAMHYPDYVLNFYFGQFCLLVGGDGVATLAEYCRPFGGGSFRWQRRMSFRYCRPSQVANTTHTMIIHPMRDVNNGKWIVFRGNQVDNAPNLLSIGEPSLPAQDINYHAEPLIRGNDTDESPYSVTKEGPARLDVRRDLKTGWQVMLLFFYARGIIIDSAWKFPRLRTARAMGTRVYGLLPITPGFNPASIALTLKNHSDGADWDGVDNPYAEILLNGATKPLDNPLGACLYTPFFYGYGLNQDSVIREETPIAFTVPVDSLACQSHCPDPRQDRGSVEMHDLGDDFPRLRNRGYLDTKITTTVRVRTVGGGAGAADEGIVTLFRGSAVRTRRAKIGKEGQTRGGFGGGAARLWPDAEAGRFQALLQGMAARAQEVHSGLIGFENFLRDENAPLDPILGIKPPWKVTDVIRYRLKHCGFLDSQLDIPDNPIRLWAGFGEDSDTTYETAGDQIDLCIRIARSYLGAYIVWDNNGGPLAAGGRPDAGSPEGAWRLVYPPMEADTPIYHFVNLPQVAGIPSAMPEAYNDLTTFATAPLESYVVPPEINHVWVFTAPPLQGARGFRLGARWHNFASYKVPGSSVDPDPDSPHYIGHERIRIIPAPELMVPGGTLESYRRTVLACYFVARRIGNFAGRAQRIQPLHAPLVALKDPVTARLRTLRFGDPVTWRGETGWFIRSVNPAYDLDTCQMADYELMKLEPIVPLT